MRLLKNTLAPSFIALILLFFSNIGVPDTEASTNETSVTFTLLNNRPDNQNFTATITLNHIPPGQYTLAFNSLRPIISVQNAELRQPKQGGDFYLLGFQIPKDTSNTTLTIQGQGFIYKYTDAPSGYFLITSSGETQTLTATTVLPKDLPAPPYHKAPKTEQEKENTSIEGNPIESHLSADNNLIVPLPVELTRQTGEFSLNQATRVLYKTQSAKAAADFFVSAVNDATGFHLLSENYQNKEASDNAIVFQSPASEKQQFVTEQQKSEGYLLKVTPKNITISAESSAGFFYAVQSLRQLLPPQIYAKNRQNRSNWPIPALSIWDYPRFSYRGLHLDVARHFVPVDAVKRLIDLMAMNKLNYFQWHLTDDEGWRIEIKKYPELTTIGGYRGYPKDFQDNGHTILPAYGSGPKPYGGYYTQEQIKDVVAYAKVRHITIVPEIDIPGHARAMIVSLASDLIDPDDLSEYTSVQGYHDNVLSPCIPKTYEVLGNILKEVATLFPGPYIHIGGDEVPQGAWTKSCKKEEYNPKDPKFGNKVQNDVLMEVQSLMPKDKVMAGWEEIASDESTLSAPATVFVWNSAKIDQVYQQAKDKGYKIIMAPAENLYFDLAYTPTPKEPGLYWAGYVDTFSPYSLSPIAPQKNQSVEDNIIQGVQGQLWSEVIATPAQLDYMAFPKIAGLAELAWTPANRRNWKNFSARLPLYLLGLDYYGVQYRKN